MWAHVFFVLSQCTRMTDRPLMVRQKGLPNSVRRVALHAVAL